MTYLLDTRVLLWAADWKSVKVGHEVSVSHGLREPQVLTSFAGIRTDSVVSTGENGGPLLEIAAGDG